MDEIKNLYRNMITENKTPSRKAVLNEATYQNFNEFYKRVKPAAEAAFLKVTGWKAKVTTDVGPDGDDEIGVVELSFETPKNSIQLFDLRVEFDVSEQSVSVTAIMGDGYGAMAWGETAGDVLENVSFAMTNILKIRDSNFDIEIA